MTCQLLKCQGARHLRPSLGDGLDVGRVIGGSGASGGVPVGLVEKAKAYEADWNTAGRARIGNDTAYIQALADAGPEVARALALKEMAKNMPSFGNITITADVLSDLVAAFTGASKAGK